MDVRTVFCNAQTVRSAGEYVKLKGDACIAQMLGKNERVFDVDSRIVGGVPQKYGRRLLIDALGKRKLVFLFFVIVTE